LLRNIEASGQFVAIMRFENQEAAQALENDHERKIWYRRLVSLTEGISIRTEYTSEWQTSLKAYSSASASTADQIPSN